MGGIVVPSHRPAATLETVLQMARRLRAPVVVVAGGESVPAAVLDLAVTHGVRGCYVVAEADAMAAGHLPMAVRSLHEAPKKQRSIAAARDLGLAVGRAAGWPSVLFLDDDVRPGDTSAGARGETPWDVAQRVAAAAGRLGRGCGAVGWRQRWFPDNSVVCHANRLAGNAQRTFVGGTLLVRLEDAVPFFPPVYNEDWLFLHDLVRGGRVGYAGPLRQLEFDPFEDPVRAVDEEFGDLVAEGLFHLLHGVRAGEVTDLDGMMASDAFWESEIDFRGAFIGRIAEQLEKADVADRDRTESALQSLSAASGRLGAVTADAAAGFVRAWRDDVATWAGTMRRLHPMSSLEAAFDVLHVPYETTFDQRTV